MRMKVSMAALCCMILAAALGTQAGMVHGIRDRLKRKSQPEHSIVHTAFHQPSDCCNHYTPRRIQCANMKAYFLTSSGCSQPGIVFLHKKGKRICANPRDLSVQKCISKLKSHGSYTTKLA